MSLTLDRIGQILLAVGGLADEIHDRTLLLTDYSRTVT
jgi:hypothetical protein